MGNKDHGQSNGHGARESPRTGPSRCLLEACSKEFHKLYNDANVSSAQLAQAGRPCKDDAHAAATAQATSTDTANRADTDGGGDHDNDEDEWEFVPSPPSAPCSPPRSLPSLSGGATADDDAPSSTKPTQDAAELVTAKTLDEAEKLQLTVESVKQLEHTYDHCYRSGSLVPEASASIVWSHDGSVDNVPLLDGSFVFTHGPGDAFVTGAGGWVGHGTKVSATQMEDSGTLSLRSV